MKAEEILKKENMGRKYEVRLNGMFLGVWEIKADSTIEKFGFYKDFGSLNANYYLSEILDMEFKEVIDWSKVKVDTKVLATSWKYAKLY